MQVFESESEFILFESFRFPSFLLISLFLIRFLGIVNWWFSSTFFAICLPTCNVSLFNNEFLLLHNFCFFSLIFVFRFYRIKIVSLKCIFWTIFFLSVYAVIFSMLDIPKDFALFCFFFFIFRMNFSPFGLYEIAYI